MWSEEWCAASSAAGNAAITEVLQPVSSPKRTLIGPTLLRQGNVCMGWTLGCNLANVAFLGPALRTGLCRSLHMAHGNGEVSLQLAL